MLPASFPPTRGVRPAWLGAGYVAGLLLLVGMVVWMTLRVRSSNGRVDPVLTPVTTMSPQQAADERQRCEGLADVDRRDDCWFGLAIVVGGIEECRRIESAQWRDTCVYQISVNTLNRTGCRDIGNTDDRRLCEDRIPKGGE